MSVYDAIESSLDHFGGRLRCQRCGFSYRMRPGATGGYMRHGWPKCPCNGETMRWWTQRQIDAGEMPTDIDRDTPEPIP